MLLLLLSEPPPLLSPLNVGLVGSLAFQLPHEVVPFHQVLVLLLKLLRLFGHGVDDIAVQGNLTVAVLSLLDLLVKPPEEVPLLMEVESSRFSGIVLNLGLDRKVVS